MEEDVKDKENQAKYLNSPETKTYKKNVGFYGLYEVRQIDKRPNSIFVVEGYGCYWSISTWC